MYCSLMRAALLILLLGTSCGTSDSRPPPGVIAFQLGDPVEVALVGSVSRVIVAFDVVVPTFGPPVDPEPVACVASGGRVVGESRRSESSMLLAGQRVTPILEYTIVGSTVVVEGRDVNGIAGPEPLLLATMASD